MRVTNAFGFALSAPATLTVNSGNVITWLGGYPGVGGYADAWNNPTNWNPQSVPSTGDTVAINSGSLTLPANASYAVLNLNGGILLGNITVSATLNWTGGQWGDGAVLAVAPSGVLNISGDAQKLISAKVGCVNK